MSDFPIPRYAMLDVWIALGGDSLDFETWIDAPKRTPADAWAQLMGAVGGHIPSLLADTNPPADELLLALIWGREQTDE
jgi:hypothetical protein